MAHLHPSVHAHGLENIPRLERETRRETTQHGELDARGSASWGRKGKREGLGGEKGDKDGLGRLAPAAISSGLSAAGRADLAAKSSRCLHVACPRARPACCLVLL